MHSRIFQLSKSPIDKDDYITESHYYDHWFLSMADYVNDDTDRDEDVEWLSSCMSKRGVCFGEDDNGKYLIIVDKVKYFENKVIEIQQAALKLSTATAAQIATSELDMVVFNLKEAYEEKYGFYADVDDYLQGFDEFVRSSANGDKYYIGATIDYHF